MPGEHTTSEERQTVRRTVDKPEYIIQSTLDESGNVLDEEIMGNAGDFPAEEGYEEYTNEEGQTVRHTVDESGDVIESTLDESGNVLGEEIVER